MREGYKMMKDNNMLKKIFITSVIVIVIVMVIGVIGVGIKK